MKKNILHNKSLNEFHADLLSGKTSIFEVTEEIIENLREHQNSYVALNGGSTDMYPPIISASIKRIYRAGIPRSTLPFFMQLAKRVENNQNFEQESKRILDTKIYKPTQWKLMMLLRELYMNINRLTVDDIIAEGKDEEYQKENQYGKLFE